MMKNLIAVAIFALLATGASAQQDSLNIVSA